MAQLGVLRDNVTIVFRVLIDPAINLMDIPMIGPRMSEIVVQQAKNSATVMCPSLQPVSDQHRCHYSVSD